MPEITMPKLSDSMEQGLIVAWLCADGSPVERGAELVEIETDKATVLYEADHSGVLHQVVAAGTTVPVGQPIATIGEPAAAQPKAAATPRPAQPRPRLR